MIKGMQLKEQLDSIYSKRKKNGSSHKRTNVTPFKNCFTKLKRISPLPT